MDEPLFPEIILFIDSPKMVDLGESKSSLPAGLFSYKIADLSHFVSVSILIHRMA